MKNFIKTIFTFSVALMAIVFVVPMERAEAYVSLNGNIATLQASNYTDCPGCTNWSTSVSADQGETVTFYIPVRNLGTEPAYNVTVRLSPQTTGTGTSQNFNATVSASNGVSVTGSASVSLSSSQSMAFEGASSSVKIYDSTMSSYVNGSSAVFSGLNVGTINPGPSGAKAVTVRFRVSQNTTPPPPPPPATYTAPQVTTNTPIAQSQFGSYQLRGSYSISGSASSVQSWFEWSNGQTISGSETFHGVDTSSAFSHVESNLSPGTYSYRACASNNGLETCGSLVSFTVQQQQPQYQAPQVTTQTPSSLGGTSVQLNGNYSISGSASNVRAWFEWTNGTTNTQTFGTQTSASFNQGLYNLNYGTYSYRACASNDGLQACGNYQTFTIQQQGGQVTAPSVSTESADDIEDDRATLVGDITNTGGDAVDRWFEWRESGNGSYDTLDLSGSQNFTGEFSKTLTGLREGRTYYYRACGENSYGQDCGSEVRFTTGDEDEDEDEDAPEITTNSATDITETSARLEGEVDDTGGSDVFRWFEYGTSSGNLSLRVEVSGEQDDEGEFSKAVSGLSRGTTYYFRACGENDEDFDCGTTRSFTTRGGIIAENILPAVATLQAQGVGQTSATLFGGYAANSTTTDTWFEYGTTSSLGLRTASASRSAGTTGSMSASISGLQANTTYFFRAVAQNNSGRVEGSILSFRTTTLPVVNPPVVVTTGSGGGSAFVQLEIDNDNDTVVGGAVVTYDVTWKNISRSTLTDVELQIVLPKELRFISATNGFYNQRDNTVSVDLDDLQAGEEDDMSVTVRVRGTAPAGNGIAAQAILSFNTPSDAQETAIDYDLDTFVTGVGLGAGLFGAGFFPTSILGWLLIILIIMLILVAARTFYRHERTVRPRTEPVRRVVYPDDLPN